MKLESNPTLIKGLAMKISYLRGLSCPLSYLDFFTNYCNVYLNTFIRRSYKTSSAPYLLFTLRDFWWCQSTLHVCVSPPYLYLSSYFWSMHIYIISWLLIALWIYAYSLALEHSLATVFLNYDFVCHLLLTIRPCHGVFLSCVIFFPIVTHLSIFFSHELLDVSFLYYDFLWHASYRWIVSTLASLNATTTQDADFELSFLSTISLLEMECYCVRSACEVVC
jgi:hypothetical protein